MDWQITDGRPVWLQLKEQITMGILTGKYPKGSRLPSVRELAMDAGVNPNTMQRAFAVLEAEQLFITRGTIGRFITTDTEVLERAREVMRRETVARLIEEAAAVGISPAELIESIRAYESENAAEKGEASQETNTQ